MEESASLVAEVAAEVVRDIPEPYEDYHADLVRTFAMMLEVLDAEPSARGQSRMIARIAEDFALAINARLGDAR